jgi:hypothetical protein
MIFLWFSMNFQSFSWNKKRKGKTALLTLFIWVTVFALRPPRKASILARSPYRDLKNRGHRRRWFPATVVPAGSEEEAGEHPGARAHPSVAVACSETVRGGLPTCAGELQRWTWRHGVLRHVADKTERPVSITRSQGSYRNKREGERYSVEVQPRWGRSWRPWRVTVAGTACAAKPGWERWWERVKEIRVTPSVLPRVSMQLSMAWASLLLFA